jgi:carbon-monoxide dehydrogenase iron sulfur subunit
VPSATEDDHLKRIVAHEDLCMGCTLCQVYCTLAHSRTKDIIKAHRRESPVPLPRIMPAIYKPLSIGMQCHHCSDPPCVAACLTGAMYVDQESGRVVHNSDKCIGCWTCVMVCPFGALRLSKEQRTPVKCDFCPELEIPACVANCPNEALSIEEVTGQ